MEYQHLSVERRERVGWLWLDRADKHNALSPDMWSDVPRAVSQLGEDDEVRAVVVAGRGPSFTVGIDLAMLAQLASEDGSQSSKALYRTIRHLQGTMSALADCPKPVVAAVHGHCLGAGIDLITACDIRLATVDATFSVRETKLAVVADVGTLQRLPNLIGPGHVAELAYTGKDINAARAERIGLVDGVYDDDVSLFEAAQALGKEIAANSPLAVQGTKAVLRAGAEMTTEQALDHVAVWNAAFLRSNDLREALASFNENRPPEFTGT